MKYKEQLIKLAVSLLFLLPAVSQAQFMFDRGEPDNGRHPNVGWIAAFDKNGDRLGHYCSGTLIAPRVFLTASHCTIKIYDERAGKPAFSGFHVYVGFTDEFIAVGKNIDTFSDSSLVFKAASVHTNPDYNYYIMSPQPDHADIAVVILETAANLTPAVLPYFEELSDLKKASLLNDQTFAAVGYGATDVTIPNNYSGGPWNWFETGQARYVGYSRFNALHPTYMILSMNFATGDSGPCYGDSGGPLFLGNSDKIAAITVWGDIMCRAMTAPLRLDTEGARNFLSQFVEYGVVLP
jgi:secreted trypsin-like serine protease